MASFDDFQRQHPEDVSQAPRRMQVTIYTDGSSRGNPGPGGYGAVLLFADSKGEVHRREFSQGYRLTTNNRMELMAAIRALAELKRPCKVRLVTDSQYVMQGINDWMPNWKKRGWKTASKQPVKNADLWQTLDGLLQTHKVQFFWVKGHADNVYNNRCDALAVAEREKFA